ncbi:hypothetical protein [Streptomyces termitum]|uniref:hypothetical protein n=1 Tax=Streptomyces termitum TaxID=67368 RepID=UPI0033BF1DEC
MAEAACELADAAAGADWSAAAADDVLAAIDTLASALAGTGPELGEILAAVTGATATARRHLGLPADTGQAPEPRPAAPMGAPGPRAERRARRRGLGPGVQGLLDHPAR